MREIRQSGSEGGVVGNGHPYPYKPVAGATGKATITTTVKDDGGVLNGGQDTFSRQFMVTVSPITPCSDLNLTNGLVGYYPLNGNSKDESSLGNHGVIRGGVSGTADRNGVANSALDFPGNGGSYVFVSEFPSKLVTNALTVSFWLTFNGGSESPRVFNNYDRSRTIASTGSSSIRRINYHLAYGLLQSPDMVENKWYHVVVVETLEGGKMFVNGSNWENFTYNLGLRRAENKTLYDIINNDDKSLLLLHIILSTIFINEIINNENFKQMLLGFINEFKERKNL
jgi:hypothetical protein